MPSPPSPRGGKRTTHVEADAAGSRPRLDFRTGCRHHVLHDREPKPAPRGGTRRVTAVEALEDPRQVLGRDADTVVGDGEQDARAFPPRGERAPGRTVRVAEDVLDEVLDDRTQQPR